MDFDLKEVIESVVEKIQKNPELPARFKKEPVKVIEELIGKDLPDEQIEPLIKAVEAKLSLGSVAEKLGGLGKLFG